VKGRLLVMCASRDRPEALAEMIHSVKSTSQHADIAVYVDDDQRELYAGISGVRFVVGPRIGPCKSLNCLYSACPEYDAYGAATDDCLFTTPNWDRWVLAQRFKRGIGALAPYLPGQIRRMDFPWATRALIQQLGFFAYPVLYHFYWDVILEMLCEDRCIVEASESEFSIAHETHSSQNIGEHMGSDAVEFARWCAFYRRQAIADMEAAIQ
jgi:hypothetical protein